MDKIDRINIGLGAVNNNLQGQGSESEYEIQEQEAEQAPQVKHDPVDPDKIFDLMKKHSIQNLNNLKTKNKTGAKSISDAVVFFTGHVSPDMHTKITNDVKNIINQEFPNQSVDPELVSEVVDNLIFEKLAV